MKKIIKVATIANLVFLQPAISFSSENRAIDVPAITVKRDENTGSYSVPMNFPSSASYISQKEIEEKQTIDINRIIREIPGIVLREEDGYGLRPNIGIRGSGSDRSGKITLMEDGILIAPAPYSAPSAYYFPSMGRVKGIEVRKGSSSIKYGPITTSGAVNLITTPIPEIAKAQLSASYGSFNEQNLNANFGNSFDNFGYVVNIDHKSSDGFKKLDGGGDTGFEVNDIMTKFRMSSDKDADIYQYLELKLAYNDQVSDETYAGLTQGDFTADPYRRYRGTALDQITSDHEQYQLTHFIETGENSSLKTTAYHNKFTRNWYKLDKVNGKSLSTVLSGINIGDLNSLRGTEAGTLDVKANAREYNSQGIQSNFNTKFDLGKFKNDLTYGIRIHSDSEDRFQYSDTYNIDASGNISLQTAGIAGSSSSNNRISRSNSYSTFIENEISIGKWLFVPGLRYEHIKMNHKRYNNPERTDLERVVAESQDAIIPGLGVSYIINDENTAFGSIHKGFAPAGPGSGADPEESVNYEIGLRHRNKNSFFAETAVYVVDYSNLLGDDSASTGGGGTGDQFNGGEVLSYGLELATGYDFKGTLLNEPVKFPVRLSYTYNNTEFRSSFKNGAEEWGEVSKGDKAPYIAPHQLALSVGAEFEKFGANVSTKYVDAMRTQAGTGAIPKDEKIPSHFVVDMVGYYKLQKNTKLFVAVDNLLNREYAVASMPVGLRPGKPLAGRIGVIVDF